MAPKVQQLEDLAPSETSSPRLRKPNDLGELLRSSPDPCGAMFTLLTRTVTWARLHPDRIPELDGLAHALGRLKEADVRLLMDPARLQEVREMGDVLFSLHQVRSRLATLWWFLAEQEGLTASTQAAATVPDVDGRADRVLWYLDRLGLSAEPAMAVDLLSQQPADTIRAVMLRLDQLQYLKDYVNALAARLVEAGSVVAVPAMAEAIVSDFSPACQLLFHRIFAHGDRDLLLRPLVRAIRARDPRIGQQFDNLLEGLRTHHDEQAAVFGAYVAAAPANLDEIIELFSTSDEKQMPAAVSIQPWRVRHFRMHSIWSSSHTPLSRRPRRGTRPPDFDRRLVWTHVAPSQMSVLVETCQGPDAALTALTMLHQIRRSRGPGAEELVRTGLSQAAMQRHVQSCTEQIQMGAILEAISDLHMGQSEAVKGAAYRLFCFALETYLPEIEPLTLRRLHMPIIDEEEQRTLATMISAHLERRLAQADSLTLVADVLEYERDTTDAPVSYRAVLTPAVWRRSIPPLDTSPSDWWHWTASLGRIAGHSPEVARSCAATLRPEDLGAWDTRLSSVVLSDLVFAPRAAHDGLRGITVVFDHWADLDPDGARDGLQHLAVVHHPLMCQGELRQHGPDLVDSEAFDRQQDGAPAQWCQLLARRWPDISVELACSFIENAPLLRADQSDAVPLSRALAFLARHLPGTATETLIAELIKRSKLIEPTDWRRFAVLALVELPGPALEFRREMLEVAIHLKPGSPSSTPPVGLVEWRKDNGHRWPELWPLLRSL